MLRIDSGDCNSDELLRLKESKVFSQVEHYVSICIFIFSDVTCVVYFGGILNAIRVHSPIVFCCILSVDLVF